jgi:hypothetical protein
MARLSISLAMLIAALIVHRTASALDIKDYYRMATEDQARFGQTLQDGAEKLLRDGGRSDLAAQLHRLFTEIRPGEKISDGTNEYLANLEDMLRAEVKREAANPNRPHLQAERAFRDMAADHGISLPTQFETVAASFRPQLPLRDLVNENNGRP